MANVVITLKVMPDGVEVDLNSLKSKINNEIKRFCGEEARVEEEPIAFGLKALNFTFVSDENKGGTDQLEANLRNIEGISSAEVIDVRRALG